MLGKFDVYSTETCMTCIDFKIIDSSIACECEILPYQGRYKKRVHEILNRMTMNFFFVFSHRIHRIH